MLHLPASEKVQMEKGLLAKDSAFFCTKNLCTGKKEFAQKAEYGLRV